MGKCEKRIGEIAIIAALYAEDLAVGRVYAREHAEMVILKRADETYRRLEKAIWSARDEGCLTPLEAEELYRLAQEF